MASKKYEELIERVNARIDKLNASNDRYIGDYQKIEVGDCFVQNVEDGEFDGSRWHNNSHTIKMKLVEKDNKYYFAYCNDNWEIDKEDEWMDLLDKEDGYTAKSLFEYLTDYEPFWNYKKEQV